MRFQIFCKLSSFDRIPQNREHRILPFKRTQSVKNEQIQKTVQDMGWKKNCLVGMWQGIGNDWKWYLQEESPLLRSPISISRSRFPFSWSLIPLSWSLIPLFGSFNSLSGPLIPLSDTWSPTSENQFYPGSLMTCICEVTFPQAECSVLYFDL